MTGVLDRLNVQSRTTAPVVALTICQLGMPAELLPSWQLVQFVSNTGCTTYGVFTKQFSDYDEVTVHASRIGLQLPQRADVKIKGRLAILGRRDGELLHDLAHRIGDQHAMGPGVGRHGAAELAQERQVTVPDAAFMAQTAFAVAHDLHDPVDGPIVAVHAGRQRAKAGGHGAAAFGAGQGGAFWHGNSCITRRPVYRRACGGTERRAGPGPLACAIAPVIAG